MAQSNLEVSNSALYKVGATAITALSDDTKEAKICTARVDICKRAVLRLHPWNFAFSRKNLSPTLVNITGAVDNGSGLIKVQTASTTGLSNGSYVTIASVVGSIPSINSTWEISGLVANTSFDLVGSAFSGAYTSGGTWTVGAAFDYSYSIALPSDFLRLLAVDDVFSSPDWRIERGRLLTNSYPAELKYIYDVTDYATMDVLFYECLALYLAWDICDHLTQSASKKRALFTDLWGGDGKVGILPKARFVDATENPKGILEANEWIESRFSAQPIRS